MMKLNKEVRPWCSGGHGVVCNTVSSPAGSSGTWQPSAQKFRDKLKSLEKKARRSLQSYLIAPVQRLPRYMLLLAELKKHTSEDHKHYDSICVRSESSSCGTPQPYSFGLGCAGGTCTSQEDVTQH